MMTPVRNSNAERRRGRDECREKLASHIYQKLGIKIEPSEVRLNPRETDGYSWRVVQGKEEMFSKIFAKNLSDHSIGTFRLLCREMGKSFEAVFSDKGGSPLGSLVSGAVRELSFTTIIEQLRRDNTELTRNIQESTRNFDKEHELRQLAEGETRLLRSNQMLLESQIQEQTKAVTFYRSIVMSCAAHLTEAMPALDHLRKQMVEGSRWECGPVPNYNNGL